MLVVRLVVRYVSVADGQFFRLIAHDPFILLAYAVLFVTAATREFVGFKYKIEGLPRDERSMVIRGSWKDPIVKVFWISAACAFLLFTIGFFHYSHHARVGIDQPSTPSLRRG